jgi:hypothetical protein
MKPKETKPTETPQQARDRKKAADERAKASAAEFAKIRARVMGEK